MKRSVICVIVLVLSISCMCLAMDHRDDLLFEDFETHDGGLVGTRDWAWGSYAWVGGTCDSDNFPPATAYSGSGMWGTVLNDCYGNLGNNTGYDTCTNGNPDDDSILSFDVDLTGQTDATLSFYEWFDVYLQWDWAEIMVDGVMIWQHCGGSFVEPIAWEEQVIDISNFIGDVVTIEFHMMSSTVINHAGWYIDDLRVFTGAPVPTATPVPTGTPEPTATPVPTFTPFPTLTPTPDLCIHHGDTNLDGEVTAGDAQMAFQIALGSVSPTFEEACAADCNGDDVITAGDAQAIFFVVLGSGTCVDPL